MNKKQARMVAKAEKAAKATVAKRHAEPQVEGETAQPVEKAAKKTVEGAMPKLPALPKTRAARKEKPLVDCACGCGGQTRSQWVPGHDARARGWALRVTRGACKMSDVPANEQAGAKLMVASIKAEGKADIKLVDKAAVNE